MQSLSRSSWVSAIVGATLFLGAAGVQAQTGGVYKKLAGKCRIGSSFGVGGPGFLPQATDRNLSVLNLPSFTSQGGNGNTTGGNSSVLCGLPTSAIAVVISASVVPRGTAGTLKVFETGKASADGNSVAFNSVDAVTNDMIVPLRSPDVGYEITINTSRATDYVLDVVGYFVAPDMDCVTTAKTTAVVAAGATANSDAPSCAAGYTSTATNCETTSWDMPFVYQSGGTCSAKNNGGASADLRASQRCCRVQ